MVISGQVSVLIYNSSASPVSLVYNPNCSITSLIDSQAALYSQTSVKLHFHGFYQETLIILQV